MNCDCCREQLPVGDGIDHQGQNLCLACYLQGASSSQPSVRLHRLDLVGGKFEQEVPVPIIGTEFLIARI